MIMSYTESMEIPSQPMQVPTTKPLSWWWIIGIAILSISFSLGMFFLQIGNDEIRMSGKVTAVASSTIEVSDARGKRMVVFIDSETDIHGPSDSVQVGQFIHTLMYRDEAGRLVSKGIQIVEPRRREGTKK
jgi:hypothetical protein